MLNTPLFINSIDGIGKSKSHDFTVRFSPSLDFDKNKDYFDTYLTSEISVYFDTYLTSEISV